MYRSFFSTKLVGVFVCIRRREAYRPSNTMVERHRETPSSMEQQPYLCHISGSTCHTCIVVVAWQSWDLHGQTGCYIDPLVQTVHTISALSRESAQENRKKKIDCSAMHHHRTKKATMMILYIFFGIFILRMLHSAHCTRRRRRRLCRFRRMLYAAAVAIAAGAWVVVCNSGDDISYVIYQICGY